MLSIVLKVQSQSLRYSIGMPYLGPGAYSQQQVDVFNFSSNQAALAQIDQTSLGVYGERRFMLSENSLYSFAAALPTSLGNIGINLKYDGFKNFNESQVGLAYARSLGPRLDLGVQFNYYSYQIPGYTKASTINFEIGAIAHFTERLSGGVHVYNPVKAELGKNSGEKLSSAYKFGLGYDASDNFFASAEIIKQEDMPVNVIGAIQYRFKKQFFARAGFTSETSGYFAGLGLSWSALRLDVAATYHPQLGISPAILLATQFGKSKKNKN
jgi:hypothetical protein